MSGPSITRLTGDLAQTSVGATGSQVQTLGLTDWEISVKQKTVECTTTDDAGYEFSLPSTVSWTATAKYAYLDQEPGQLANVLSALSSTQTAKEWNFFPTVATGRASWKGIAYVDSYKLSAGVGKDVALDVTLKGVGALTNVAQLAATGSEAED